MATKIRQKPKITKKSNAKPSKIGGGGAKSVQHVHGLSRQEAKTAKVGGGRNVSANTNKMPMIVEYPGERKGRSFGKEIKTVGNRG